MDFSPLIVLIAIAGIYAIYFALDVRARRRGGYGETPQEAHDYFAGTVCHCYTDGTRVLFDRLGNLISFECADV